MDIEAIVKKHMEEQDWYNFPEDSLRAALTELAAGYEAELARLRRLAERVMPARVVGDIDG